MTTPDGHVCPALCTHGAKCSTFRRLISHRMSADRILSVPYPASPATRDDALFRTAAEFFSAELPRQPLRVPKNGRFLGPIGSRDGKTPRRPARLPPLGKGGHLLATGGEIAVGVRRRPRRRPACRAENSHHVAHAFLLARGDGGHRQLELPLRALREIHSQPVRNAAGECRNDDLVELLAGQRVFDGG